VRFSAEVQVVGRGGHALVVPTKVTAALSSRKVPVLAQLGGVEHRTRLAVFGGRTYLGLPGALLRQLGLAAGDTVEVELTEEPEPAAEVPADLPEPADLTAALAAAGPVTRTAWAQLGDVQRQEYHRWLAGADEPAVRAARLARLLHRLGRAP
jgi:hypothetical protein